MTDETPRLWLPVEWLDEMNPSLLDSPDAFIDRVGESWVLRLPEGDPDRDSEFYRMDVEPGQIVSFMWTESHGDRLLTLHEDGSHTLDEPLHVGTTHLFHYEEGVIADSVAELISGGYGQDPLTPGEHQIATYSWSDEISYRFDVDAEGKGRFVSSAGAN